MIENRQSSFLLVCYSFPPNPGVGGRRWAKFAKYMRRKGMEPIVLANQFGSGSKSPWTADTEGIRVQYIPYGYPSSLNQYPKKLWDKVKYRVSLLWVKWAKGNYYDRSLFVRNNLLNAVKQALKTHQINTVLVTCPPFRQATFLAELKKEMPGLRLLLDFRDPWTDNTTFFGFDSLSPKRLRYEKEAERQAVMSADKLLFVNKYYLDTMRSKYPSRAADLLWVPNGFDREDVLLGQAIASKANGKIRIICAGTVYNAVEYLFEPFLEYLAKNLETLQLQGVQFEIYGDVDNRLKQKIRPGMEAVLKLFEPVGLADIHGKISEAAAVLTFISPNHADNFNTKFYEYLAHRKPLLIFSNLGEISSFVKSNRLGITISSAEDMPEIGHFLNNLANPGEHFNTGLNLDEFDIEKISEKLINLLYEP